MAEKPVVPPVRRKPVAEMTPEEMRALLLRQAGTARTRGTEYRAKMRKQRMKRYSVYVPEKALPEVRRMVDAFLAQRRLDAAVPLTPVTVDVPPDRTSDDPAPDVSLLTEFRS